MFLIEYILYYFSSDENDVVSADQALLVFLFFILRKVDLGPLVFPLQRLPSVLAQTLKPVRRTCRCISLFQITQSPKARGNESFQGRFYWSSHILISLCIWMARRHLFSRWYWCSSEDIMNADLDKLIFISSQVILNLFGVSDPFECCMKALFFWEKKKVLRLRNLLQT